jgi:hypothetical protein
MKELPVDEENNPKAEKQKKGNSCSTSRLKTSLGFDVMWEYCIIKNL